MNAKQIFTTLAAFALFLASGCNAQNKQENTNAITQSHINTFSPKFFLFFVCQVIPGRIITVPDFPTDIAIINIYCCTVIAIYPKNKIICRWWNHNSFVKCLPNTCAMGKILDTISATPNDIIITVTIKLFQFICRNS